MTLQYSNKLLSKHAVKAIIWAFLVFVHTGLLAQPDDKKQEEYNLDKSHLAINGYDPVSYYNGKALKGKNIIKTSYHGIIYQFANEVNKARFIKAPDNFVPKYGGWCAYAMGESGEKIKVNPKTYKIADGKLYLFYDFFLTNTLEDWNKDEQNLKIKADKNWANL